MSEIYSRMQYEVDANSQAKCKERRRRRIEMRRLTSVPIAKNSSPSTSHHRKENQTKGSNCEKKLSSSRKNMKKIAPSSVPKPMFGMISVSGMSRDMEDAISFGMMSVPGRREMEDAISVSTYLLDQDIHRPLQQPIYFFAVYDGHGGSHVSELCKEKMHLFVQEELTSAVAMSGGGGSSAVVEDEATWRRVMRRSFERMDKVALCTCACGSVGGKCWCHPMQLALGGSTAVFAVLTPDHIIVANCGDSRAVLRRGERTVPLSYDHKPDRIDELERIKAAGGRVIFINGARVEGILAMSRAIGDKYLKSFVISEPEITFTKRRSDDECLILATDGLWDVLSSELACGVACECLHEETAAPTTTTTFTIDLNTVPQVEEEGGVTVHQSRSTRAATLLTRLALGRKSRDNISVIVIDLKTN